MLRSPHRVLDDAAESVPPEFEYHRCDRGFLLTVLAPQSFAIELFAPRDRIPANFPSIPQSAAGRGETPALPRAILPPASPTPAPPAMPPAPGRVLRGYSPNW